MLLNIKVTLYFAFLYLISVIARAKKPSTASSSASPNNNNNNVNILLILADDLGFGDTSVFPFTGTGISTPELEKMAAKGAVLTNFHSAAATCTPTRASILTGMYPWRLGIKGVYEYGEKAPRGNRDDWLPQVPTMPMLFRSHNYTTYHSGKWHVGGMRNDDLDMRTKPGMDALGGVKRCLHPGPNQQGFDQYVSVLDGPGAPRQNQFQVSSTLHSQGCKMLLQNDVHIGGYGGSSDELLSDCEVRHGVRMMTESVRKNEPFYLEVWFHAPHGPWEYLSGPWDAIYDARKNPGRDVRMNQYRSMVSAMDRSIGKLLAAVKDLGIEQNTLIVFTSDNGPEDGAGKTAGLRGNKRFIYEGGIRVPTIAQWVGHIPAGSNISTFAVSTDLFPTFAEAAGLAVPSHMHLDGISLLPQLIGSGGGVSGSNSGATGFPFSGSDTTNITFTHHHPVPRFSTPASTHKAIGAADQNAHQALPEYLAIDPWDRIAFWHNDWEGPRLTAAWLLDFKLLLSDRELPLELFDMRVDPFEKNNLLTEDLLRQFYNLTNMHVDLHRMAETKPSQGHHSQAHHSHSSKQRDRGRHMGLHAKPVISHKTHATHKMHLNHDSPGRTLLSASDTASSSSGSGSNIKIDLINDRSNPQLHLLLLLKTFRLLENFAQHGNEPHQVYLSDNPQRRYEPTVESDIRSCCHNVYKKVTRDEAKVLREKLLSAKDGNTCGATTCACAVPYADQAPEYPFNKTRHLMKALWPGNYPLASSLLFDSE